MFKKLLLAMVLGCFGVACLTGEANAQTKKTTSSTKQIEAKYKQAIELINEKDTEGAMDVLDQILELDPNQSGAWALKSYLYNKEKNFKQAERAAKKSLVLDESFAFVWFELGFAQASQGKFELAVESFEQAIELNPKHWVAYECLAFVLNKLDREDEADKWTRLKASRMAKDKKATNVTMKDDE